MFASYMIPKNTVVCFFAESVCMLLPSVVRIVSSFPHIHLIAAVTVYLVCDTFFSARSEAHWALVLLWWLTVTRSGRIRLLQHTFDGLPQVLIVQVDDDVTVVVL